MKAVYIERFGGPEVLTYGDVSDPVPSDDEVLIEVAAASVNAAEARALRHLAVTITSRVTRSLSRLAPRVWRRPLRRLDLDGSVAVPCPRTGAALRAAEEAGL